jgi:Domain of unknown function (DUF4126)
MLTALGLIVPLAFASGVNLYATVAVLGLSSHYGLVALPEQFRVFDNPIIITAALAMYLVEFVADKIPWFDSMWDAVHTVVRPLGGALVATTALGEASPAANALVALVGGSIAMTTHLTKAGTRAAANASPEPFSNWALSLGEDVLAVGISYAALQHPIVALVIAVLLLAVIGFFASMIVRFVRRRFRRMRAAYSSSEPL